MERLPSIDPQGTVDYPQYQAMGRFGHAPSYVMSGGDPVLLPGSIQLDGQAGRRGLTRARRRATAC